jgi:hypothetical protein
MRKREIRLISAERFEPTIEKQNKDATISGLEPARTEADDVTLNTCEHRSTQTRSTSMVFSSCSEALPIQGVLRDDATTAPIALHAWNAKRRRGALYRPPLHLAQGVLPGD